MKPLPKKSPSLKARRKPERDGMHSTSRSTLPHRNDSALPARSRTAPAAAGRSDTVALHRREFRAWRALLPTQLERDTLLWPEVIAESVVAEATQHLDAELPTGFAERLAARAYHLYPRHRHFHKMLNRPGNRGRANLYAYMRHWTAGWLKRERYGLFKRLPWSYTQGKPLPQTIPRVTRPQAQF